MSQENLAIESGPRRQLRWLTVACGVLVVICVILLTLTIVFSQRRLPATVHDEQYLGPPVCLQDYQTQARSNMPTEMWLYFTSGATSQQTAESNVAAYRKYRFRPKVLVDVANVETWVSVLGKTLKRPVGIAPMPYQQWPRDGGDLLTATAAQNKDTLLILSAHASKKMEDVRQEAPHGIMWQEVYLFKKRTVTIDLIRRAEQLGMQAIVVTLNQPSNAINYDYERGLAKPPSTVTNTANFPDVPSEDLTNLSQTWEELAWLKNQTMLPLVLKGVLTAESARRAASEGMAAIIVSNHGGRVLDGTPATIDALSEVAAALNGTTTEVYLDGGIRSGGDVVKAMALGARMVFLGRPMIWGLHYGGQEGVEGVLEVIHRELVNTMEMMGTPSPRQFSPDLILRSESSTDTTQQL